MNQFLKLITVACIVLLLPLTFAAITSGDVWVAILCITSILAAFVSLVPLKTKLK